MKRIISFAAAMAMAISALPVIQPTITNANDDGSLTISALLMVQKWLLGYGELTNWKNADFFEDEKIDVYDLCLLRKELIKQE